MGGSDDTSSSPSIKNPMGWGIFSGFLDFSSKNTARGRVELSGRALEIGPTGDDSGPHEFKKSIGGDNLAAKRSSIPPPEYPSASGSLSRPGRRRRYN